MGKTLKLFGLSVVVTLALASCYRVEVDANVNDDGSGTLRYLVAINYEAAIELSAADAGLSASDDPAASTKEEICQDFQTEAGDIPPTATVEPYDEGGYCGFVIGVDIPANNNFDQALADAAGADTVADGFSIKKSGDGAWTFLQTADSELTDLTEDSAATADEPAAEDPFREAILDTLEISYRVTLPGEAARHNADDVTAEGGKTTFEWSFDFDKPNRNFEAATTPAAGNVDAQTDKTTDNETSSASDETATTETENQSATNEVDEIPSDELGFTDDSSSNRSTTFLFIGLLAILAVLGAVALIVIKWPLSSPATAGVGTPGTVASPNNTVSSSGLPPLYTQPSSGPGADPIASLDQNTPSEPSTQPPLTQPAAPQPTASAPRTWDPPTGSWEPPTAPWGPQTESWDPPADMSDPPVD